MKSLKEQFRAAKAAFSVGNSWVFACRFRLSVEGRDLREQDIPLKEQDRHLRVEGQDQSIESPLPKIPYRSEAQRTN